MAGPLCHIGQRATTCQPCIGEIRPAAPPAEESFINSVFVRQRLRLAAKAIFEMLAVIFRMPESILGEAEPAL